MSEWEYKLAQIGPIETGLFVCRGTEWRLLFRFNSATVSSYAATGSFASFAASEIAVFVGWDCATAKVAALEQPTKDEGRGSAISAGMGSRWTEAAVRRLRELRGTEVSYPRIARRLTKEFGVRFTSSMCSSKADRMGIRRLPTTGGRKPKVVKVSMPALEAKADEGDQTGIVVEPHVLDVSVASADAGAEPAAGTIDAVVGPQTGYLNEAAIESLIKQIAPITASAEAGVIGWDKASHYPRVTIPTTIYDVVSWYKSRGHDIGEPGGVRPFRVNGEYMTSAELIKRANNQRLASGEKPFVVIAPAIALSPSEAEE